MIPKDIIFSTLKAKFEEHGVISMIMKFNVIDNTYDVFLRNTENKSLKIDIDKSEITMIKMIFVNKIRRKYEKEQNEPLKCIIAQIDFENESFELFTENTKNNIYKFNL